MNDHKAGLKRLLNNILADRAGRIVIITKIASVGVAPNFGTCEAKQLEAAILNQVDR